MFGKTKKLKLKPEQLNSYFADREILEITGSGDPHEEYAKVRKFIENIEGFNSDVILFDGDYLAEPAYIKKDADPAKVAAESIDKLKTLFEVLENAPAPTHFVAGNYEIPGTTNDALEALSSDKLLDLGCDKSSSSKIDKIHDTEEYMGLQTERVTWPGKIHDLKGFTCVGVEGSNPINQTFPGERTEDNLDWALKEPMNRINAKPEDLMIVTHSPPFGIRDHLGRFGVPPHLWGASKGSTALRKLMDAYRPFMVMVGHIHESFGVHISAIPVDSKDKSDEIVTDMDFARRTKLVIGYDTAKTSVSITLNKGTLEYWNWSRVRIAQEGTHRIIDIEGEWLERKGTPKPHKKVNHVINYDDVLETHLVHT
ncbi:MAG: metallophosphoesterase [Candidatus Thorarchaeota archaeon]